MWLALQAGQTRQTGSEEGSTPEKAHNVCGGEERRQGKRERAPSPGGEGGTEEEVPEGDSPGTRGVFWGGGGRVGGEGGI